MIKTDIDAIVARLIEKFEENTYTLPDPLITAMIDRKKYGEDCRNDLLAYDVVVRAMAKRCKVRPTANALWYMFYVSFASGLVRKGLHPDVITILEPEVAPTILTLEFAFQREKPVLEQIKTRVVHGADTILAEVHTLEQLLAA